MKYLLILLYITLLYCKETKNILAFVFPGAKSHNFVFKAVFQHSVQRIKTDNRNLDYKFHILVHNSDKYLWKDTNFEIHGYGDITQYDDKFKQAMDNARADPILGYLNFSRAMIHIYRDFFNDGVLGKLKKIKFDLILPDVVNFLTPFLKIELAIEKQMYLNPTCILTWDFDVFEYNAAYHPILGTKFSENMTFFERFINSIYLTGTKVFYKYFAISQVDVFKEFGYDYHLDPFPKDSMYLNQCVNGVHYSFSLPPNIISIGSVLPEESKDIKDKVLNDFLIKHEFNIYISQGTITDRVIRLDTFNELFESFPNIGFILSLKDEFEKDYKLSENVLRRQWFPQNDLLGHPKLTGFITHGGLNSILESLYHAKPMITIGINIDQVNSAVIVNYRKYGIGITDESGITISNLKRGVNQLISNKEYKENCIQASPYVREQNGREKFYKTLSYVLEHGYDHLLVPAYSEFNFIQLYNIDIHIIFIVIAYVIYRLFKRLFYK